MKKLYVESISATGDFKISSNWAEGKYLLRAYTNNMKNDSTDYFFQKEIPIWKNQKKDSLNT